MDIIDFFVKQHKTVSMIYQIENSIQKAVKDNIEKSLKKLEINLDIQGGDNYGEIFLG